MQTPANPDPQIAAEAEASTGIEPPQNLKLLRHAFAFFHQSSGYAQIGAINELAGNVANGGWAALRKQLKLLQSELNETIEAVEKKNIYQLRDGMGDMMFVLMGMQYRAGLTEQQARSDLHAVIQSNLTKFDDNPEDVELTHQKYAALGIDTVTREGPHPTMEDDTTTVTLSARAQTDHEGKEVPAGKWLKSHHFVEPTFEPINLSMWLKLITDRQDPLAHQVCFSHSSADVELSLRFYNLLLYKYSRFADDVRSQFMHTANQVELGYVTLDNPLKGPDHRMALPAVFFTHPHLRVSGLSVLHLLPSWRWFVGGPRYRSGEPIVPGLDDVYFNDSPHDPVDFFQAIRSALRPDFSELPIEELLCETFNVTQEQLPNAIVEALAEEGPLDTSNHWTLSAGEQGIAVHVRKEHSIFAASKAEENRLRDTIGYIHSALVAPPPEQTSDESYRIERKE